MKKEISINFVLPGRGTKPVGGFRIAYEYANRLSALGMKVTITHVAWLHKRNSFLTSFRRYFYMLCFYRWHKKWIQLHPAIANRWVAILKDYTVPDATFIVATSWETAEHVTALSASKGKKLYLVQANESEFAYVIDKGWEKDALNTWALPFYKIAVSSWLKEEIAPYDTTGTSVLFNGLNFEDFYLEQKIEARKDDVIMMLYHKSLDKASAEGLIALRKIKEVHKNLRVLLFGMPPRPAEMTEDWIEYHRLPSREELRELYNRAAIFLSPSHTEGWGLPASEAMQCGCAVVTSDIGGFKDFVIDGSTAICFKVGDIDDMVNKVSGLMIDRKRRIELAQTGHAFIQRFNWERATEGMVSLLKSLSK